MDCLSNRRKFRGVLIAFSLLILLRRIGIAISLSRFIWRNKMIKRIGVLTSGGDAPGMNAAIRAVVRAGIASGLEVYGIHEGYRGLVEDKIDRLDRKSVTGIINRGGTVLKTARLEAFKEIETRQIAVTNLKKHGIEALVVIGGDGSYMGAMKLTEMGINCIGLPGTIDNDIASTDLTIGFDTCLNTIMDCVDKIRDTAESHNRCYVIEVMGHYCGDLALYSGIAEGVDLIIEPEHRMSDEEILTTLKEMKEVQGRKRALVIISENLHPNINQLCKDIESKVGYVCRPSILGYLQRGGNPSCNDRLLATRMGVYAVNLLLEGKGGRCVGIKGNTLVDYDIYEALKMPKDKHEDMIKLVDLLQ